MGISRDDKLPFDWTATKRSVWRCEHCGERRVYGWGTPEPGVRSAWLRCQRTFEHRLHTFEDTSDVWIGRQSPLGMGWKAADEAAVQ